MYSLHSRTRVVGIFVCGAWFAMQLTGCHPPFGGAGSSPPQGRSKEYASRSTSLALNWPVDESGATPRPADVGLVVCDPLAKNAASDQSAFGAGCTRWLHLIVGGQGELAQTPAWTTIDRARREMNLDSLRLGLDDTPELARKTGAAYCLVGEIRGTAQDGALTLALAQTDTKKLLGKSLTVQGSRKEIVRQLPALAREIAARLGVKQSAIPAVVEGSPEDLSFLGSLPWLPPRDLPEALAELRLAQKQAPNSLRLLKEIAYAYRQNIEPQKAIPLFLQATRISSNDANLWGLLGDAYLDARNGKQAVAAYVTSLNLNPQDAINWRNLSKAYGLTGQYQEGIQAAEKSFTLNANDEEAHGQLAYLYGQTKNHQKAAEEARAALQLAPRDAIAHGNLGEALMDLGQKEEARKEWETALQLDPNGPTGKSAKENLAKHR